MAPRTGRLFRQLMPVVSLVTLMVCCSAGFAATIADPASRSGVWEATENIAGSTVHFRLNVFLRTDRKKPDGTFELRGISARLFSTSIPDASGAARIEKPLSSGLLPICDLDGQGELVGDQLSGPCRETGRWRRVEGTFDSKGETVRLLLIGDLGDISITFDRIPIDNRSLVDGYWRGTADSNPRNTVLQFRTDSVGEHIVTFDGWVLRRVGFPAFTVVEAFWGLMNRFNADGDTVKFQNEPSIPYSEFVGKVTPDKQRISGHYSGREFGEASGREFAADTFERIKQ